MAAGWAGWATSRTEGQAGGGGGCASGSLPRPGRAGAGQELRPQGRCSSGSCGTSRPTGPRAVGRPAAGPDDGEGAGRALVCDHGHSLSKTRKDYRSLLRNHCRPSATAGVLVDTLAVRGCWPGWTARTVALEGQARLLRAVRRAGGGHPGRRLLRNPAAGVRSPRISPEMQFLSAAEVEQLAEAIPPPYGLLVRFAAYTGLRAGEIAALRVKRLDLLRGTVRVSSRPAR